MFGQWALTASSRHGYKTQWRGRELITVLKWLMFCVDHFAPHHCISTNKRFLSLTYMLQLFVKVLPHTVIITNNCLGLKVIVFIFWFMLQEKLKLDAEREKLERLQELYSEQKTQLDNCPESMREQLQQQLKRVSSKFQDCTNFFFLLFWFFFCIKCNIFCFKYPVSEHICNL